MAPTSSITATSVAAIELPAEPLRRVFSLDTTRFGSPIVWAVAAAIIVHVAGGAQAYALASGTSRWARDLRRSVAAELRAEYEIDLLKPPPPPPPPPEPEEEQHPAPTPQPKVVAPTAPKVAAPPPAPAQAGKIITKEPSPDEPVDLTGEGFVTGNSDSYAGGVTANNGTSVAPVRNLNAQPNGVPGGTGKGPVQAVAAEDRSRPCSSGATEWDCPFPSESDVDQIDHEVVPVVVTVRSDGSVQAVRVTRDPGHGFGRVAKECAFRQRLSPGLDRGGQPITSTCSFNVRFTR